MSEGVRQESPLVERITPERKAASPAEPGVTLRERAFRGYINLRGDSDDSAFLEATREVLGIDLPLEPNTVIEGARTTTIWLGPNEWYVVTPAGEEREVVARLEEVLAGRHFAVNDVTGYYTTIVLEGPSARAVLEKGCTLDLHPRAFTRGQCAQTLLAHAGMLVRPCGERAFELVVRRSLADYVFVWLEDAAEEYGLAVAD